MLPSWELQLCAGEDGHLVPSPQHALRVQTAAWGACMPALEVILMGDFNYISLLHPFLTSSSPSAADMSLEQTQGTLIKRLVLNSLLLERPAFISLAQQTTETHKRFRLKAELLSNVQVCLRICIFETDTQRALRKKLHLLLLCFCVTVEKQSVLSCKLVLVCIFSGFLKVFSSFLLDFCRF